MNVRYGLTYALILCTLIIIPVVGTAQGVPPSCSGFDPQGLVEFDFTNSDISEVIRHVVQLTGGSVFYDPVLVQGNVSIVNRS